jgi:WD40 repeat protein
VIIFNNDKQIVSSGSDGVVRIWDLKKKTCISVLDNHQERVWSMVYDERLYTASVDGIINVLKDKTDEYVEERCKSERNKLEMSHQVNKSLRENRLKDAIRIMFSTEDKRLYDTINMYIEGGGVMDEIFEIFCGEKAKFIKCLGSWTTRFKNSKTAHILIEEGLKRKWFKGEKNNPLLSCVKKHLKCIDGNYIDLLSVELLFKEQSKP